MNDNTSKSLGFNDILKEKLLEVLRYSLNFFDSYNLKCFGCGGTVLGAVRHKGFIPWDDDIDLYMPRADYDRLIGMTKELEKDGYSFVSIETDSRYYLPFGKIIDMNTSVWEVKRFPFMLGVYIDIFPLDEFDPNITDINGEFDSYKSLISEYQYTIESIDSRRVLSSLRMFDLKEAYKRTFYTFYNKKRSNLYHEILKKIDYYRKSKGSVCVSLPQWPGRYFESDWFKNSTQLPFEDVVINVPGEFDKYLTLLYGDYMTPPPVEMRQATHGDVRYYINLKERITIKEAKSRILKGESLVY